MITYNSSKTIYKKNGKYVEGSCLSTDTKPTEKIINGVCFDRD